MNHHLLSEPAPGGFAGRVKNVCLLLTIMCSTWNIVAIRLLGKVAFVYFKLGVCHRVGLHAELRVLIQAPWSIRTLVCFKHHTNKTPAFAGVDV